MENSLVSMAQQFSGLPMKSLIGAPLNAAADANANMAITQTQFLLETCFQPIDDKDKEGGVRRPIMVKLEITRPVINQDTGESSTPAVSTLNLPILTILPLNSLAVKNVDVSFEMEVKSSYSHDTEKSDSQSGEASGSFEAGFSYMGFSAKVEGSVKSTSQSSSSDKEHYEKSNSAKYTVAVNAGQLPLPEGVTTIIQAYTAAIQPIMIKNPKNEDTKPG
ncbi:DUF2589 domain-containing protein [Pseudoalteromonas sp. SWXJ133]|jgi:hypothetical protein|uniref:DUF2589 domain-containing protein n=1 Tax=unclassified Pseudoalteromonas TaxID=194690 RepID=UPI00140C7735|nr:MULTISPECIES: DUF2589 domain-containing protein [unclassified Pseudoalteromonas]MBH0020224.1 DUF2589 domain-containing protein [Pseudoalteromonas sp. SWXJ133]